MEIKGMEITGIGLTGTEIIRMDKSEIIKSIEEIGQRLTMLQLSMELLATHTNAIKVLTTEELKNSTISSEELLKYWDKVNNGNNLHTLTNSIAIHSSNELGYLIYDALEDTKESLQNINRLSKDIL